MLRKSSLLLLTVSLVIGIGSSPLPHPQANDDQINSRFSRSYDEKSASFNTISAQQSTIDANQQASAAASPSNFNPFASSQEGFPGSSEFTRRHNETRIRDRERRLMAIRQHILSTLGQGKIPTQAQLPHQVDRPNPSSPFSGKLQTFYASCELPSKVDLETWNMPGFFHIFFNVTSSDTASLDLPSPTQTFNPFQVNKKSSTIISAKLKLYKKGTGSSSTGLPIETPTSKPCNDTLATTFPSYPAANVRPTPLDLARIIEEKIRVSVYWYTIPASKNHYKRKRLDTKMLSVKDNEWVEFDIQKATKEWVERGTNYGLIIEVENEDDDLIDASRFFTNAYCPTQTSSSSNSTVIRDTSSLNLSAPFMEICTLSVPSLTQESSYPQQRSFQPISRRGQSSFPWPNSADDDDDDDQVANFVPQPQPHRRRHHHGAGNRHQNQDRVQLSSSILSDHMQQDDASNLETTTKFELDPNHPLRHIFATASTKFGRNSHGYRRKHFRSHSAASSSDDDNEHISGTTNNDNEYDSDENPVRRVIIENIFVEQPSSSRHRTDSRTR